MSTCVDKSLRIASLSLITSELVADLLVRFSLERKDVLPGGWAPRTLIQAGVPFVEIWDAFHEMYESHVCDYKSGPPIPLVLMSSPLLRFHHSTRKRMSRPSHPI